MSNFWDFFAKISPLTHDFHIKTLTFAPELQNTLSDITKTFNNKKSMKKLLSIIVIMLAVAQFAMAQADKVVGTYQAVRNGVTSKVKVFKHEDGYRAQVIWVDNIKKEDGSIRLDEKNPNAAKRKVRADQIVLIDKVKYNGKDEWNGGKIYDPTSGKVFTVALYFKDAKTLTVKGSIGPFFQRMYWTKL